MPEIEDPSDVRQELDSKTAELVGLHVTEVEYWDLYNDSEEPRDWDYYDWHHAVMGVQLTTDAGPRSIIWTNTFYPYGVEVFADPITRYLRRGPEGPEGWSVEDHLEWQQRATQPIQAVSTFWERLELSPAQLQDGTIVRAAATHDVPVAFRLDFLAGPVWFVAGIPHPYDMNDVFVPGDEIMVVFSTARMHQIGFPEGEFIDRPPADGPPPTHSH